MLRGGPAVGDDDIRRERHQVRCVLAKRFGITATVANFEAHLCKSVPDTQLDKVDQKTL